ncbi:MAG TPA: FtsW/RodA/SpoVE family cell cycle protein [Paludibacteraceae bacterium]|nr:FtsW/RodA/SpoVE family cell cycle protein [Paludibacteraceae bacterium]HQB68522.1 FtsW/RodA/SpoVE family cell cycle protein [Paludibacteraceae bacterium]HRS67023.1 FtsW/RodA/SpoVE family cell cycle protein [Paludibacteraceae bacterium]
MNNNFKNQLKGDYVIWMVFFFLCIISILEMFSASSILVSRGSSIGAPILQHIMYLGIGTVAMIIVQQLDYKVIKMLGYAGWMLSIGLLIFTMAKGVEANDAQRWLKVGGVQFQPSELAKLCLIIMTADWISRAKKTENSEFERKYFKWIALAIVITCGLILPENFSTAALLFTVISAMLFCGQIAFKRLAAFWGIIILFIALVFTIAVLIPKENYQADKLKKVNPVSRTFYKTFGRAYTWVGRIENFTKSGDPNEKYKIHSSNLQPIHGQIAIARGGFFPHGPGTSVQRNLLPEAFSDFIFAIIVEELGLIGGVFVIMLYLILLFRAGRIVWKSTTVYPAVLVMGLALIIVLQAFVHIAVSVQLIPVTGQPLPLISRGGTSILITSIYFGLILSVTRYATSHGEVSADVLPADELESGVDKS